MSGSSAGGLAGGVVSTGGVVSVVSAGGVVELGFGQPVIDRKTTQRKTNKIDRPNGNLYITLPFLTDHSYK